MTTPVPSVSTPPARPSKPRYGERVNAPANGASINIPAPTFSIGATQCTSRVRQCSGPKPRASCSAWPTSCAAIVTAVSERPLKLSAERRTTLAMGS